MYGDVYSTVTNAANGNGTDVQTTTYVAGMHDALMVTLGTLRIICESHAWSIIDMNVASMLDEIL